MNSICRAGTVLALPLAFAVTGCAGAGLGGLEDILAGAMGGGQQGQVRAEIQRVDERSQTIQVTTQQGQSGNVRYDRSTQVIYQQQQYPVNALERGDLVVLHIQQNSSGESYVGRIDVEQSVRERSDQTGSGQVQLFRGQVGQIDHNQGAFQLRTQTTTLVVTLPYNPPSQTLDRFHRLRQGENIAVEGRLISQNRVELSRFR